MDFLSSPTAPKAKAVARTRSLGKVGIFILIGFIGLVFATTYIGTQATTPSEYVTIRQDGNVLNAEFDHQDSSSQASVNWSWFSVRTSQTDAFNNKAFFGDLCETIALDLASVTQTSVNRFVGSGLGDQITLKTEEDYRRDGSRLLYCFTASAVLNGVEGRRLFRGGFIPSQD